MKVGFYSPMPPARTGVADYSAALLPALRKHGDVEYNARRCDVALYHLGNNQMHREVYERALRQPGVVVLHDAVLNHFLLGALTRDQYVAEFVRNYGEWTRDLGARLWDGRARSAGDPLYFRYPMLRAAVEEATAVIVHNPGAAEMVRAHAPGANIIEIPHFAPVPVGVTPDQVERVREEIGAGRKTLVVGLFGHLRESKRVMTVLRVVERLRRRRLDVVLLMAGEAVSADLCKAMAPLASQPGVVSTGYLEEADFWRYACAVDACVNLRYPTAGETSGIAIRMMSLGKPVLVTMGPEVSRFPDTACLRVDPGPSEENFLEDFLVWMICHPEHGQEIGASAREYIRREHCLEKAAGLYWAVLKNVQS